MYHSDPSTWFTSTENRRRFPRLDVQCRARIRIGKRQYAGFLDNISEGGARLRTLTPIRRLGKVILRLPDLPPLHYTLRWTNSFHAGVAFELPLTAAALARWTAARSSTPDLDALGEAEIVERYPTASDHETAG
ncbi:hypothetical protein GCM10023264_11710 [Sphingomonas daechungensis]|uniref:PilZ domain-containing protein n=1 Tax=Sphingomonas daechungensis TaxID=1176646 RepID=A0ABX6SXS8_9SPHN|nr:PilZ domain-containing protein [Sphingomonas daechungensis]QNP42396.1 PilZ domain-containing protein [Sphingomonas daechungensis]